MGKRVILAAMLLFATLGVVRGQEYIDDGWYYLLYDDFGERTAVLETSTRPVEDIETCRYPSISKHMENLIGW